MSREMFPCSLPLTLLATAGLLIAAPGCGNSKPSSVTSATSQYAPADDSGSSSATSGEGAGAAASTPPRSANRDVATPRGSDAASPKLPANGPAGAKPSPAANPPARTKVSYEVPNGGVPELLAYIYQLDEALSETLTQAQSEGRTLESVQAEAQKNLDAQAAAAEKILAQNPDEDARVEAISAKARSLQAKFQLQAPGAEEALLATIDGLANDPNEDLKQTAAVFRLTIPLTKLKMGLAQDPQTALEALDAFLAAVPKKDTQAFAYAIETIRTLQMLGNLDESIAAMRKAAKAFANSDNQRVAIQSLSLMQQAGQLLEYTGRVEEAKEAYAELQAQLANVADEEIRKQLEETVANAQKRIALVGQPLKVENMIDLDGKPLDWAKYQGKVVLIDFWATWCGPCIAEIPNIAEVYAAYKDQGFEVIGVNLDEEIEDVKKFFSDERLDWAIAIPANPEERGFANLLAVQCSVDAIPFMLLLNQAGNVAAIHTRGPRLEQEVRRLLNLASEAKPQAGGDPGSATTPDAPQPAEPASPPPSAEAAQGAAAPAAASPAPSNPAKPSETEEPELDLELKPPQDDGSARGKRLGETAFVAYFADENGNSEDEPASEAERPGAEQPSRNPYLADAGLSTRELVEFIQDMQDKPRAIQQRPGFAEAVAEAADRVLADREAREKYHLLAALAKFRQLHDRASFGDEQADRALAAFVEQMKGDPREKIAQEVKLLQLERRALEADKLAAPQIEQLLADLKAYLEERENELGEKHLRLASAAVGAINKIEDGQHREKLFQEFGSLFAASNNKELARYGKRLAKVTPVSSLVGKPLELAGATELGVPFDWAAFRGKVVVVDFWASWCGPCRRAAPLVKAFWEQHRSAGLEIVGVNLDQDAEALAQYLAENEIPWSNIVGEDGTRLAEKYGVRGIPTFMLIDRTGAVREVGHAFEDLQAKIEALLKAS